MPRLLAAALVLALAAPAGTEDAAAALAEGDAHYARRAEGARGAVADARETDLAIAAYRRALAADPASLDALNRLLRASNFRGSFCGADLEARKRIYDEARQLGQGAVDRLEKGGARRSPADRIAVLRAVAGAADTYYWTAASWGQWALLRGTFASARAGVAGRVRDLAQTSIALDPTLEEGGGYRVLGRLHAEAPRLPFVTGWISRTKALDDLRRSYELGPRNPVTWFFLGEAILDHDPARAEEGRRFLRLCVDTPPRADYHVESLHYAELARARLAAAR